MDDDALIALFDGNPLFRNARMGWTAEQTAAFCIMARAAHDAGLDWYHTNMRHNPVRLGRKSHPDQPAQAAFGYLDRPGNPRMWLSERSSRPQVGAHDFPVDFAGADNFVRALQQHADAIATWRPPEPVRPGRWPHEAGIADGEDSEYKGTQTVQTTTNLILYGPPGTGKTHATAAHAVRLCGEAVPDDRNELMTLYKELADAGRIEFVTFHQSMAYEEFVEGLRPSSLDEDGRQLAAGFRLAPTPGIFRKIADRAGSGAGTFRIGDRKVFKMSIGEANNPGDAHLFDDAVNDGYALLGYVDQDWSDPRFTDGKAIADAIRGQSLAENGDAAWGKAQILHGFRNDMRVGDVIVVSKGNKHFRAIGEIAGGYEYAPRDGDGYAHRRKVRWLWVNPDGEAASEISGHDFMTKAVAPLNVADLNVPALERYANSRSESGAGTAEPFVLVIDEINRANISKVFGELITLLEADKRLERENELTVRLPYSGDRFGVPANLHIIGTMNTADRSIALIDKALRRRFTFVEMMPDYTVPGMDKVVEGAGVTLADVLRTINNRIEYLLDREHQIGHGWLLGCDDKKKLDAAMREKIIPLIAEYFFEDWGRTADVLGGRENNPFLKATLLARPPGLAGDEQRTSWSVRSQFREDAYTRLIG